ncbi:hypothetical protein BDN72DRAFT_780548, partial [Pluteus cervinus]
LRTTSFRIINSTTKLLPLWKEICKKHGLEEKLIPRDVTTRWNSTFDLADVSCEYKVAINEITKEKELRKFEMLDEEWVVAEQLRDVLKSATEYFSRADTDLSHVLRTIDRIDDHFTNTSADSNLNPALRSAILCTKRTLNKYYSRTDDSITYRIATSKYTVSSMNLYSKTNLHSFQF